MKTKLAVRVGIFGVLLISAFSCGEDPTSSKIGSLYLIDVTPSWLYVEINSTRQLSAIGRDANMNAIDDLTFTWTSLYQDVGTVDQTGLFIAISSGTTFLTAKSGTVESDMVMVTVYDPVFSITDIDGNVYRTIKIGNQWWMAENLKVTHYRNGEEIANVTDDTEWTNLTTGACCEYDNNSTNVDTYGCLYNWYAVVDSRNIAPEGWHVPTDDEWKELEMTLGMSLSEAYDTHMRGTNQGSQLAGNTDLWAYGALENNTGFGSSGIDALPGGYRYFVSGGFYGMGRYAYFWSSAEGGSSSAWDRRLSNIDAAVYRGNNSKQYGFSVRLVRD